MSVLLAERLMPLTSPAVPARNLPGAPFRWREKGGTFIRVDHMETRHLFYTVRMIWNHTMPPAARSQHYVAYHFSSFYTAEYMLHALAAMCPDLLRRTDLTASQQAEIDRWTAYFARSGSQLDAPCFCRQCLSAEKLYS